MISFTDFIAICNSKKLLIQEQDFSVVDGDTVYNLTAHDKYTKYECEINSADNPNDITNYEANYQSNANQAEERRTIDGDIIIAPTLDDVKGLYPKKKMYRNTVIAGQINFFDIEVLTERRICGGEYWINVDDIAKVHKNDFVEFSIIDKNNILGLFSTYGLVVGVDILELSKFVINDYVKKGNSADGYHSQLYEGIKGTNKVIPGLFYRAAYNSSGAEDLAFLWRLYYYE